MLRKLVIPRPQQKLVSIAMIVVLVSGILTPVSVSPAYALADPIPMLPEYGEVTNSTNYPPLGIPEVVWYPVAGAEQYRIQFSPDSGFGSIPINTLTYNSSYTPVTLKADIFNDGNWYWRVKVEKPSGGGWSPVMMFQKQWASDDNAPQPIAPLEASQLDFFDGDAVFSWQPVTGAARYRFQIAQYNNSFDTPLYEADTLVTSHQPKAKLENGQYYWRVVPLDYVLHQGTPSQPLSFYLMYGTEAFSQVPQLIEPADNSQPVFTPSFRWTAIKGAQRYQLETSSDPTCKATNTGFTLLASTFNTSYTPLVSLPNNVNYCWRVRAVSGRSTSDWSPIFTFLKKWDIQPALLTPTNAYQYLRAPLLSWSPVAGAAYYKVQVSPTSAFDPKPPSPGWESLTANTTYVKVDKIAAWESSIPSSWFWRVVPMDYSDNEGNPSAVYSFTDLQWLPLEEQAPSLVYPPYYYAPNTNLSPHEDPSVPYPVFVWQRSFTDGIHEAEVYRIEVDDEPNFFAPHNWDFETQNLSASPTAGDPFSSLAADGIYYWRVCILSAPGGPCLSDPRSSVSVPLWSQTWKTRIDPSVGLPGVTGTVPSLLRPAVSDANHWWESVENAPLLEWLPVQGVPQYEVEISSDPEFDPGYTADSAITPYPVYTPSTRLDYSPLSLESDLGYGTYYWHVRALNSGGTPVGTWSQTWRFQIARQSQWYYYRYPGQDYNRTPLAYDPNDRTNNDEELTGLYGSEAMTQWFIGLNAYGMSSDVKIGVYVDTDHNQNSGATFGPPGYNSVTATPAHLPEYAFIISPSSSSFDFNPYSVTLYTWSQASLSWDTGRNLATNGGDVYPSTLYDVAIASTSDALTGGRFTNLLDWDGATWDAINHPLQATDLPLILYGVDVSTSGERWAVGEAGTILHDTGFGWSDISNPGYGTINAVEIVSPTVSVAAGSFGNMYHWRGSSWSKDGWTTVISANLNDVSMVKPDGKDGWAVGSGGAIARWIHTGGTTYKWAPVSSSPTTSALRSVSAVDATHAWAVGDAGTILKWDGSSWTKYTPSPVTTNLQAVSMVSASDGWAVGDNGVILRWNGTSWNQASSPVTGRNLYGVDMLDSTHGWIVGDQGVNLAWNGSTWASKQDPIGNYIELMFPSTLLFLSSDMAGTASLAAFTVDGSGNILDTTPTGSGEVLLDRFTSISEKLNIQSPPSNVTGDPTLFPTVQPFYWSWPTGVPWEGHRLEVATDELFNDVIYSNEIIWKAGWIMPPVATALQDLTGNDTYYWRVRPNYIADGTLGGAYSLAGRFERQGFGPQNLSESVSFATPTFSWDMVEGAEAYNILVDTDTNFATPVINKITPATSYTADSFTLAQGNYYWKVCVRRWGSTPVWSGCSEVRPFTLTLPVPQGLLPNSTAYAYETAPTLCWDPVIESVNGYPVFAAYQYYVEVATDDQFSTQNIVAYETTEQTCWTPPMIVKGFDDGTFYWHVKMIDGNNHTGGFSITASFAKQYPAPTAISPLGGVTTTPTFVWTPVDGAAKYRLEVSTDPSFPTPLHDVVVTYSTFYRPIKIYPTGKTYYWRVAMIDTKEVRGPFVTTVTRLDDYPYRVVLPLLKR